MADPERDFPDFFGDSINVAGGPYGVTITFFASEPQRGEDAGIPGEIVGRARISPEMAGALSGMLADAAPKIAAAAVTEKDRRSA